MSLLHKYSCECVKSELDLFALPSTQTSIEGGQWVHYKPLSSISDESPLEFVVHGGGDEYLDLAHTMLYLNLKICKEDGSNFTADDDTKIGPVNNLVNSLFSQIDVYLNQKLVSPPNNTYAYKAYIETLLNYGPAAKKSHLTAGLWYTDTAGKMNSVNGENSGFQKRYQLTSASKNIDLLGHLHCDVFNQEKFLINGVEVRMKLVKSRNSFVLMGAENTKGKIVINDASLLIRRVKINPTVLLAHSKVLEMTTAKYPVTRSEIKVITIPAGVQGKTLDNVFLGQMPKRCIVGFVSNKSFNGDMNLNPFDFQHHNLNFVSLYVDGHQIPSKPLQPDFVTSNKQYVSAYHTLFSGTGIHFLNEGNDISREDFPDGYCLMAFDLTPDLSANSTAHWNLIKNGSLRVEVRFQQALKETVNCLIFGEFDNIIEIDKNRNVVVDYSS